MSPQGACWGLVTVMAVLLMTGCSGGEASDASNGERSSEDVCESAVRQRVGPPKSDELPWRITSREEGDGYQVSVWTHTPGQATRPIGVPNYVCVTMRDRSAKDGFRLVEVRP